MTTDLWRDVENLTVKHREREALRRLMAAGSAATPVLRRGLAHPDERVRVGCSVVLDHFLDEAAVPELVANLTHPNERVRGWALHALACDNCKEGACRPGEHETVPLAMRMLSEDPSAYVRSMAIKLLAPRIHDREDVVSALERARDADPSPRVRRAAALRTPGGAIFERTRPHPRGLRTSNARSHLSRRATRRSRIHG
jgi:HEAT repeat protein